jgi:hypothetical protein
LFKNKIRLSRFLTDFNNCIFQSITARNQIPWNAALLASRCSWSSFIIFDGVINTDLVLFFPDDLKLMNS